MAATGGRVGDPPTPFKFALGERVAKLRDDGTPDPQCRGQIVDREQKEEGGWACSLYYVQMANGSHFKAAERELITLEASSVS